ncbi:cytochrome c [Virgibacillus sp. C22-A2]|uniref:Cytochrome c n=1 Tax=Virgibacillus tibetensis TaxID=3042313 RepID=A0ABU6KIT1_9BACI|nr:cytochrome c [Virgibacillus sp. C22-A2]
MDFNQGKEENEGTVSVDEGLKVYENNCLSCQGAEGAGGHNGSNLQGIGMDREQIIEQVKNRSGGMPGFEGTLTEEEIEAVTEYLLSLEEEGG